VEHITNDEIPIIEPGRHGYWEIYDDRKIWHPNRGRKLTKADIINQELDGFANDYMLFPSKQKLDEERQFMLLPQDDYELVITDIQRITQNRYMAKPDKDGKIPQEDVINFTLEVVACKDGSEAKDEKGNDAGGRRVFFTGRPESMGFKSDGTPSKTRCLVAYALGQDVEGDIELEEWEQLLGNTIFAEIVVGTNQKGQKKNKITRILPPPRSKK